MVYARPCLGLALAMVLTGCTPPRYKAPPAQDDPRALLGAVSSARVYACGQVGRVARIDRAGYRAQLVVTHVVSGPLRAPEHLEIAWEELASHRPPRFSKGDQVLVALSPLPGTTLWLQRFPPQLRDGKTFVVAAEGTAFMRNADCRRLQPLQVYASLAPAQRATATGARALAELGASAEERLAVAALEILRTGFDHALLSDAAITDAVARALRRSEARVKRASLELARVHRLEQLRKETLEIAESDPGEVGSLAWEVLVAWKDPQVFERLPAWASAPQLEWRLLAAKAAAANGTQEVIQMALHDPVPAVRQALAEHLPADLAHLASLLTLLGDPDLDVRRAAATKIGRVGLPAVAPLEQTLSQRDPHSAQAALLALAEMGTESRAILERVAAEHPDEALRQLAALALGQVRGGH